MEIAINVSRELKVYIAEENLVKSSVQMLLYKELML